MLNEWLSVVPAIFSQLMILFLPGFLITIQFKLPKRIILGLTPFVSISLYRCIGELYLRLNVNFNFVTVALFVIVVIGATFVCFGSRKLTGHLSFKITKRNISILSIVAVFTLLAGFQYIQQAKSPYDIFVWGDMLSHQEMILRMSQDQLVQNDFIGYPVGSHILAVLNIGLTHIQITTSLIILEFVGAVLFILGMCDLGSFIFKDRLRGVLCGGLIGLVAYTGVRYEPIVGWVFAYYFALCLFPLAMAMGLRMIRLIVFWSNFVIPVGFITLVCSTFLFVHPSMFPVILLFCTLGFMSVFFKSHPWVCLCLLVFSMIIWGFFAFRLHFAVDGELKFFGELPYTFTYVSDFFNQMFFILCFVGACGLLIRNIYIFCFCFIIIMAFLLAFDGAMHLGYSSDPVLAFLLRAFTGGFYSVPHRVQALYIIIMGLLALFGFKVLGAGVSNFLRLLSPVELKRIFLTVELMILICFVGFYYADSLQLGSSWSNRNLLFLSGSTDEYQRLVNDIQRERQFVYQAKRVLPENALVQIEENEGGHILRYFQDIEATPWRTQSSLDFDPNAQGVLETCALIESSPQEIFFLELSANPYKAEAGFGPNFEFYTKYKTVTILNDGVNVLYQLDCIGHSKATV